MLSACNFVRKWKFHVISPSYARQLSKQGWLITMELNRLTNNLEEASVVNNTHITQQNRSETIELFSFWTLMELHEFVKGHQVGWVVSLSFFHLCGPRFKSHLRPEHCMWIGFSVPTCLSGFSPNELFLSRLTWTILLVSYLPVIGAWTVGCVLK